MSKTDKTTEASQADLSDEQLDGAQGGASFLKLGDIEGMAKNTSHMDTVTLNFPKVEIARVNDLARRMPKTRLKL